jgi:ATP-dependent Clp protease ATP-binding subunit ClpB
MTSNLGADILANLPPDMPSKVARDEIMAIVRARFPPEFINRIDDIILFNRLTRSNMDKIVDIQMKGIKKLMEEKRTVLDWTPAARKWLGDAGYDLVYGARPLKRIIQREILNPLSTMILEGDIREGDVVRVDAENDKIVFFVNSKRIAIDDLTKEL